MTKPFDEQSVRSHRAIEIKLFFRTARTFLTETMAASSSTALAPSTDPAYQDEAAHRADEDWWARQLMNCARKAKGGVWYTFEEFVKFYSVPKFPGTNQVPGDDRTIRMHKERMRGLKHHMSSFDPADRARHSIASVVCDLEKLLNQNLELARKRKEWVMPKWEAATGLTRKQSSDLNKIIWAWKRRVNLDERDLEGEEEDAEWPYQEDCYPLGSEWDHGFYSTDQWRPPHDNSSPPRTIEGTRGRICLDKRPSPWTSLTWTSS